jgi:hypothetical protein
VIISGVLQAVFAVDREDQSPVKGLICVVFGLAEMFNLRLNTRLIVRPLAACDSH